MSNLTSKELTALEEQIGMEATMVRKCEAMAGLCQDASIAKTLNDFAQKHREHYNTLYGFLQ